MSKVKHYTALDIGTNKICTVIVAVNQQDGEMRVLGVGSVPSKGLRKSQIIDLEEAVEKIDESVTIAERMAGVINKDVFVSVGGAQIQSQNSEGMAAITSPNDEITSADVKRALDGTKAVSMPSTREVLHVIPQEFRVDTQEGIRDPVGMSGVRLEAEAHIITGATAALKTIEKCLSAVGLSPASFVFSGLASAYAVLTDTEKELGVVCVDIGAGTTSLSVYLEGALRHTAVLPVGALHITKDLAAGLIVSLESAEKLKRALSEAKYTEFRAHAGETKESARERRKKEDVFSTEGLQLDEDLPPLSKRATIEGLIFPRLEQIFELIKKELKDHDLLGNKLPAGIVLTGGGALTAGVVDVCKKTLDMPARVGKPSGMKGLSEDLENPVYATVTGLIRACLSGDDAKEIEPRQSSNIRMPTLSFSSITQLPQHILQAIRSLLP